MDAESTEIKFEVDGRTLVGRPRPEDEPFLAGSLGRGETLTVAQSDLDTEGHVLAADEVTVDVEGHAMTLRLPNAADAAALRRALAVATLTATVGAGAILAGTLTQPQAPTSIPAIVAPAAGPRAAPVRVGDDIAVGGAASRIAPQSGGSAISGSPVQNENPAQQAPQFRRQGSRPQ